MLRNLQAARAVAAIGVVVFHVGLMLATRVPFLAGAAGVDLFFILSGFIIAHSVARSRRHFIAHRLIRVVPAYWMATSLAALLTLPALGMAGTTGWLVQSLFYLPGPGGRPALIFVAWTLVYELFFYVLYWTALRLGPRSAPSAAIVALVLLALVPMPFGAGPWPLLLEFALGIALFVLFERTGALRRVRGSAGLLLAVLGVALLPVLAPWIGSDPGSTANVRRVLCWSLPAATIILGLLVAERDGLAVRSRAVDLLGAASYAIYLVHPITLGPLMMAPVVAAPFTLLTCLAATAATVGLAVLFHLFLEKPTLRWMRGLLHDPLPVEQRVAA